jgi:integrase
MFTDPEIYNPQDLSKRGFIKFYYEGKRYRFYTGKALDLSCFPNNSKTFKGRQRLLKQLLRAFSRALLKGWSPKATELGSSLKVKQPLLVNLLSQVVKDMEGNSYSKTYKRDIVSVTERFAELLKSEGRQEALPDQVFPADIERFLQQFSSSGTYYQNKRRTLAAVFSKLVNQGYCKTNPVSATTRRKAKAVLHQAYTPEQLAQILPFLQNHYPNMYLCALIIYGVLLRPHQEVRLLKRKHFNESFTQVVLDGNENKSGKIRSLPVPDYVREELMNRKVDKLNPDEYVFTASGKPFNESYFNTMWSRAKAKMLQRGLISSNQTLYSFRHAASVNVFDRTQSLKLLQQLLGHSSLNTSLIYLRSIGMIQLDNSVMPEL